MNDERIRDERDAMNQSWIKEITATRIGLTPPEREFIARLQQVAADQPVSLRLEVVENGGFEVWKEIEPCVRVLVASQFPPEE